MKKFNLNEWSDWIDGSDVMMKLNVSQRTLQRWRTNGILPFSHLNGKYYYRKSDILRLLNKYYNGDRA